MESQGTECSQLYAESDAVKHLVTAVVMLLSMATAPVLATTPWWIPSPVGIALTVGQWLMKDHQQVYYIQVKASAADDTAAREEAFRVAINQAVGSLLISERRAVDDDLVRNEILNYSSGYIYDFKVLQRRSANNLVEIEIDVWVARSQIADRILSRSEDRAQIPGGRISAQIESFDSTRQKGDRVLEVVLADFPKRAFDVAVGRIGVGVDQERRKFLEIPISVTWNPAWLASLDEAVKATSHWPDCDTWLNRQSDYCRQKTRVKIAENTGFYDDHVVGMIFERRMTQDPPRILLSLLGPDNQVKYQDCWIIASMDYHSYHGWHFYEASRYRVNLNTRARDQVNIALPLTNLPPAELDRAEIAVIPKSQCPR